MTKRFLLAISIAMASLGAQADENYDHFAALESPDVATAFCNLQAFNTLLNSILDKPSLSAEDMVKVHELTYTLENALAKLTESLEASAVSLEEVHLASERLDEETIKAQGQTYKQLVDSLMAPRHCTG